VTSAYRPARCLDRLDRDRWSSRPARIFDQSFGRNRSNWCPLSS